MRKMDIILIVDFFTFTAFVVAMIVTFWTFGAVPDVLITCVVPALGLELVLTAVIKVDDQKRERQILLEDRKYNDRIAELESTIEKLESSLNDTFDVEKEEYEDGEAVQTEIDET